METDVGEVTAAYWSASRKPKRCTTQISNAFCARWLQIANDLPGKISLAYIPRYPPIRAPSRFVRAGVKIEYDAVVPRHLRSSKGSLMSWTCESQVGCWVQCIEGG